MLIMHIYKKILLNGQQAESDSWMERNHDVDSNSEDEVILIV